MRTPKPSKDSAAETRKKASIRLPSEAGLREPRCDSAVRDPDEEITQRITFPPKIRLMMLLEKAQVAPYSKFNIREFMARMREVRMGEYNLKRKEKDGTKNEPQIFYRIVDTSGKEFILARIPDDISKMTVEGKKVLLVEGDAYCLMPNDTAGFEVILE